MNLTIVINRMSNVFTMYKGIVLGLFGIWAAAFALSLIGQLTYSPLALVASLVVAVASVYAASYACGRIFQVAINAESSLITGLILALIITPSTEIGGLVVLLFAGLIAGVSKFVVVHNGRHIFNPAALGAFVIGVAGLGGASWWVATPLLAPIVTIVILISLYKTHRMLLAGVFLAVSVPLLLIVFSTYGTSVIDSLVLLLSFPILFIAGIMITEPLTLPPRKWQMYVEAAVVGVLIAIPFHLVIIDMTPALAILIGNIVALLFTLREKITLELMQRKPLTPTTDELVFSVNKPIPFVPGQYIEVQLPHKKPDFRGHRRSFSMTSVPATNEVSFGVKFYQPSSTYKAILKTLPIGTKISATGYWGDFVLPKDVSAPLLYVAGGIGVTPFISHLQTLMAHKEKRNIVLIYAVNNPDEIAYKDVLMASGVQVVIVCKEKIINLPHGWKQIRDFRLNKETIAKSVVDVPLRHAYISGPTPFVTSTKKALRSLQAKRISTDYFTGY
jgi:ferredoxin-NADP reductase